MSIPIWLFITGFIIVLFFLMMLISILLACKETPEELEIHLDALQNIIRNRDEQIKQLQSQIERSTEANKTKPSKKSILETIKEYNEEAK